MQKRALIVLIAGMAAVMLIGCSKPAAAEVPFAEVCNAANDGQRLATVGYYDLGTSVYCSDTGGDYRCGIDFRDAPDSENRITADMLEGSRKNQMAELPDDYTEADLKIKTADGGTIGVGQKARISGKMLIGEGVCLMSVDTVEPAE